MLIGQLSPIVMLRQLIYHFSITGFSAFQMFEYVGDVKDFAEPNLLLISAESSILRQNIEPQYIDVFLK